MGKKLFVFDDEDNSGLGFEATVSRKNGIDFSIWNKKIAIEFREPFHDLGEQP